MSKETIKNEGKRPHLTNPDFFVGNTIMMTEDSGVLVYSIGDIMTIEDIDEMGVLGEINGYHGMYLEEDYAYIAYTELCGED